MLRARRGSHHPRPTESARRPEGRRSAARPGVDELRRRVPRALCARAHHRRTRAHGQGGTGRPRGERKSSRQGQTHGHPDARLGARDALARHRIALGAAVAGGAGVQRRGRLRDGRPRHRDRRLDVGHRHLLSVSRHRLSEEDARPNHRRAQPIQDPRHPPGQNFRHRARRQSHRRRLRRDHRLGGVAADDALVLHDEDGREMERGQPVHDRAG